MLNYYVQYDATTGIIYPLLQEVAPITTMPILGPYAKDTAPTDVVMAYMYPDRYLVQEGQLVAQPYFSLEVEQSQGAYTITATLNNPPTDPPLSATFAVAGQEITKPIASGQVVLTLGVHPSIENQLINLSVTATGCVKAQTTIGGTLQQVGLQVYTPSGGVPTVAPTGPNSLDFLSLYYAQLMPEIKSVTFAGVAVNLLIDVVFNVLLPAVQKASYAPVTLDPNQDKALGDIQINVLPSLYTKLENAYPAAGAPQIQYEGMVAAFKTAYQGFSGYIADATSIPNLE